MSSLKKYLFGSLPILELGCLSFCYWIARIFYKFWIFLIKYMIGKYFLPFCWLFFFLLLMVSFDSQTLLIFMPNLSIFWLCHVACGILFPQPGIKPRPLAVKVQSPNHWTDRKFPCYLCFWHHISNSISKSKIMKIYS